ncbi:MAG: sulfatase-like hydrolase/transferase [Acidobacteria bacterium]|jgi:arylsulfatase A-like enzyme/Tfp pilus assembly protein PilF|nr:sulfatase-like hydrolase/transferase [Acidobacteriota bacterium]
MKSSRIIALLLALVCLGAAAGAPPASTPSVILVTLDTTRFDHVGYAGCSFAETPAIDQLAKSGAAFFEAQSHVPLTLPSHATIMTGLLPTTLNLRVNGLKLKEGVPTIATILKQRGYATVAVVASTILASDRGLARGFDVYDDHMTMAPRGGGPPEERRAEEVTAAALSHLQNVKGPLFLWVHYYDPHYEYIPPEPFASRFKERPYDGEIAYMDSQIAALFQGLKRLGLADGTLVAVMADHGEGLGEHGEKQHGIFLYDYALRVPLIISWPGHIPEGTKVHALCGLSDVAPTLLDLLGINAKGMDGRSLAPLMLGKSLPPRDIYAESYQGFFTYGWSPLRAIVSEPYKYIEAPRPEMYRWLQGESENLLASEPAEAKKLEAALGRYPKPDPAEYQKVEEMLKDPSNAEALRALVSLGYLSGASPGSAPKSLLDPKDAIGIEAELAQSQEELAAGDFNHAESMLLGILKRNPQNVPALSILGGAYLGRGKLEKAKACFIEEVRLKPQMDSAHLNLGTAYKRLGDAASAEKEYKAALAVNPAMREAIASLAELLVSQNRLAEAKPLLEGALSRGLESADLFFELGMVQASGGDLDKARFSFTKALSFDPTKHEACANLGRIAFQQGRVDEAIMQFQRAIRIQPNNQDYLATLGSLYLNGKNDGATALGYFRRALAADPYGPKAAGIRDIVQGLEGGSSGQHP